VLHTIHAEVEGKHSKDIYAVFSFLTRRRILLCI
jgi:hypothetical protein